MRLAAQDRRQVPGPAPGHPLEGALELRDLRGLPGEGRPRVAGGGALRGPEVIEDRPVDEPRGSLHCNTYGNNNHHQKQLVEQNLMRNHEIIIIN